MSEVEAIIKLVGTLDGVVGAVLGAIVGAVLASRFLKKSDRERRTIDLFTSYQKEVYPKYAVALDVFKKEAEVPAQEVNDTKFVGNWFDVYAALRLEGGLSRSLSKRIGLDVEARKFWCCLNASKVKDKISSNGWPNLCQLVRSMR